MLGRRKVCGNLKDFEVRYIFYALLSSSEQKFNRSHAHAHRCVPVLAILTLAGTTIHLGVPACVLGARPCAWSCLV